MSELEQAAESAPEEVAGIAARAGFVNPSLWRELTQAPTTDAFCAAWLELQTSLIDGARRGVVVIGDPESGAFSPRAYWPAGTTGTPGLSAVCEAALSENRGVVRTGRKTDASTTATPMPDTVGLPVIVNGQACGVVAFELAPREASAMGLVMRQLQWGAAWLETWIRRERFTNRGQVDRVLDIVATSLDHPRFRAAATAVATELSTILGCDRVSIGFRSGAHTTVRALSHSAEFGQKSNLIRSLGSVMDEAADQHAVVVFPPPPDANALLTKAHGELSRQYGAACVCTAPLIDGERIIGAVTLERPRDENFSPEDVELCRHVAALIGPILETKLRDDRWLAQKAWGSAADVLRKIFGPRHVGLKLAVVAGVVIAVFLTFAEGEYRIKSDASIEGTVERAVTAPIAGYILESHARAGDVVARGQVLATLDEKDLRVERVRLLSQKEQRQREYSKALAEQNRAEIRILGSQIAQADAQLELIDGQLERTRITAPFDGVVVTGDLSQSLSAPVERGDVLFEVAPLDSYRVALKVDEREITQVEAGQTGQLALAALTGEPLDFIVEKVTPVSTAEEGRNYFRVEANLLTEHPLLRPGMEGVGKINVDRRKLAWIYLHKLVQSIRMRFWSWWP